MAALAEAPEEAPVPEKHLPPQSQTAAGAPMARGELTAGLRRWPWPDSRPRTGHNEGE